MDKNIKGRIFIVGCPRSGTTLLQSFFAAHSEIETFPESHLFLNIKHSSFIHSIARIASPNARNAFSSFLSEMDQEDKSGFLEKRSFFSHQYSSAFIETLDAVTIENGKKYWLEKTPKHLLHIKDIERSVKNPQFIHILRSGADVVASLYDAAMKYPDTCWSSYKNIDKCIYLWTKLKSISNNYVHNSNHILVNYETLIEDTRLTLENLFEFLNIPFEESILSSYKSSQDKILAKNELWKTGVSASIKNSNGTKFYSLFNKSQQDYILEKLSLGYKENTLQGFKRKIRELVS